jgi:hypothetical protein
MLIAFSLHLAPFHLCCAPQKIFDEIIAALQLQWSQEHGEDGTDGAGLHLYRYRVRLGNTEAVSSLLCIKQLTVDFGDFVPLDFNSDGSRDDVFYYTDSGEVAPSAAAKIGNKMIFTFSPPVCPDKETSFFGLASIAEPSMGLIEDTAELVTTEDTTFSMDICGPSLS